MELNKVFNIFSPIYYSLCIFALILFLMSNVNSVVLNSDQTYNFLIYIYILLSVFSIVFKSIVGRVLIYKHFFIFIIFIIYFFLKSIFQYFDLSRFFSYSLGSSGGIVLFYFLGTFFSLSLIKNKKVLNFFLNNYFILIFYLIVINIGLAFILKNAFSNVRLDIFLISDLEEGYQRAGDFLIILFFIVTILVFFVLEKVKKISINVIVFCLYLMILVLIGAIAQIIGSNKGLVVPILICTCTFFIFFKDLKGGSRHIIKLFIFFTILLCLIYAFLNIDISSLRILGYGSGESSSLQSRYEIFVRNFYIHFTHSPYIGDLNVDTLLTGQGTYIHSFLFFSLTHFGMLGFVIIFIYIFSCYGSIVGENQNLKLNKVIFLIVLIFSILSTAVFWPVIWFVIGALCPAFLIINKSKTI